MDNTRRMQRGQRGEHGHEHDPGGLPVYVAILGGEEVVPQGLGALHVLRDGIGGVVLLKNGVDRDEGGQAAHFDELAPEVHEAAEKRRVLGLVARRDDEVIGVLAAACHGVRQKFPDGDRGHFHCVISNIGGTVSVGSLNCTHQVALSDHGAHGQMRRQLQGVVVEVAVRALFRSSNFLHAVHAQIFIRHEFTSFCERCCDYTCTLYNDMLSN